MSDAHSAHSVNPDDRPFRMQFTENEMIVLALVVDLCRGSLAVWPQEQAILEDLHTGFGMMIRQGARVEDNGCR